MKLVITCGDAVQVVFVSKPKATLEKLASEIERKEMIFVNARNTSDYFGVLLEYMNDNGFLTRAECYITGADDSPANMDSEDKIAMSEFIQSLT